MKASSKRRRGKAEIKEQKRAEVQQQSEIVRKLQRIEELEQNVNAYKASADRVISLENNIQELIDNGLLRYDADGNCHGVHSWEEHQQLKQVKEAEILSAATIQQQM